MPDYRACPSQAPPQSPAAADGGPHLLQPQREFEPGLARGERSPVRASEDFLLPGRRNTRRQAWAAWLAPALNRAAAGRASVTGKLLRTLVSREDARRRSGRQADPARTLGRPVRVKRRKPHSKVCARAAPHGADVDARDFSPHPRGRPSTRRCRGTRCCPPSDVDDRGTIEVSLPLRILTISSFCGLMTGVWPPARKPDPWHLQPWRLRSEAGLLVTRAREPDFRRHDFRQGFNASRESGSCRTIDVGGTEGTRPWRFFRAG